MGAHRSSRVGLSLAAGVVTLALMGTACGGASSGSTSVDPNTDVTVAPAGSPQAGGSITVGLEAETDGFDPTSNRWGNSGYMIASAVFDPLTAFDADGNWQPYLAQSFTSSADFRTWTITLRPGVSFTNGEPLDGAAVVKDLNAVRADLLTGAALANVASVAVDPTEPLAVIVTTTDPWASFPAILSGQIGFMAAPAQLDAPKPESSNHPIGTGPFMQKEWVPDSHWSGVRNPNYWRTESDGTRLPHLDSVEFRPIVDPQSRVSALTAGDVDMITTSEWGSMARLRDEASHGSLQFVLDRGESEENFILFNTQKAPLDDVRVRRGLAFCSDPAPLAAANQAPLDRVADSQFAPDSPYYVNTNFPRDDVAAGKALIDAYRVDHPGEVRVVLTTNPVASYMATTALLAAQWERCGVSVDQRTEEQSRFISDAVTGQFEADLWRQFSGDDPDTNYVWWTGRNARGPLTLNTARLKDDQIDAALDRARASADPAVRVQAYADLQRRQTELVPYLWIAHAQWAVGAADDVQGIGNGTLPDGRPARRFGTGVFRLTQAWLDRSTR